MVSGDPLRIVFFGTPAFAVPSLETLIASRHPVVAVVTQPDRPRGRGQRTTDSPVKAVARRGRLTILQPDRLKDDAFLAALRDANADLGVVAAYGKILPEAVLATPRLGLINVHASLLPKYRGAAPVHRAVMAGDPVTGVTIMHVVRELDAGPMLSRRERPIGPDETSDEVERALAAIGATLLLETIEDLAAGRAPGERQDDHASTYAPRLTKAEGLIDWSRPALAIHNQVRGLHPWPHAFAFLGDERLILLRTRALGDLCRADAGTIVDARGRLIVCAGDGQALEILDLQAEGARAMSAREFLAGHPLRAGDRFRPAPAPH